MFYFISAIQDEKTLFELTLDKGTENIIRLIKEIGPSMVGVRFFSFIYSFFNITRVNEMRAFVFQ